MKALRFTTVIKIRDGNPYVDVSAAQAQLLAKEWRKPMPVLIRVNGEPAKYWRINMMPTGEGSFYLYLHGDVRKASKTKVGDRVDVEVVFDESYKNGPLHPMPSWFSIPLSKNKKAQTAWDALPPSRQKEILRYFSWLKSEEAQQRNLAKALAVLSGKEERFMARSWKNGK